MRLAISMWSYFQAWRKGSIGISGFIHEAKRAGAQGVELLDFFYRDPSDPWNPVLPEGQVERLREEALEALAATGLPCPIFSISQNFAKPDAEARAAELDKVRFGIGEAPRYGASVVRVFAGDVSPGITYDQARGWIVDGLVAASHLAHEAGLKLALENHGQLAGKGEQIRGLIEEVREKADNDALGANPDTGNFLLVDQPSHEAIRLVAPLAYMVHFKDFRVVPEEDTEAPFRSLGGTRFRGAVVGEGIVDLQACLAELRTAGFDGCLSIEYEGEEDCLVAAPRCVRNAAMYL